MRTSLWTLAWLWLEPSSVVMVWPSTALEICLSSHSARRSNSSAPPAAFAISSNSIFMLSGRMAAASAANCDTARRSTAISSGFAPGP
ncbi:hypothetical protein D9M69_537790 [compost metagenome]